MRLIGLRKKTELNKKEEQLCVLFRKGQRLIDRLSPSAPTSTWQKYDAVKDRIKMLMITYTGNYKDRFDRDLKNLEKSEKWALNYFN